MIIGEIRRYLRDNNAVRVSRSIKDTAYKAMQVKERLMAEKGDEIKDRIQCSFNTLSTAYSLTSEALMSLIADVKLGVIFGIVPLTDTAPLDKLTVLFSASSLTLKIGECAPSVRDITRAKLVREILSEVI